MNELGPLKRSQLRALLTQRPADHVFDKGSALLEGNTMISSGYLNVLNSCHGSAERHWTSTNHNLQTYTSYLTFSVWGIDFDGATATGNTPESHCVLEATTQTAAAISGPSCRHVCSAAYLFKPAAGPGGPTRASPGASSACLRIHSHLRIKLLTLMLPVLLGPASDF
ncbi:hypothetical protein JOB18_022992 [Solea senegalensis]|uniref:Uncharacterized protein n=1 Tax=Solea senegalensis TaxID=28829 RepID=A0AAV6SK14_SOLSE|nr:hypothetical protein JOB18_022992 [Solea senegalensis]